MASPESLKCPGCGGPLKSEHHAEIEIDRCVECGDLWFDRRELGAYLALRRAAATGVDWAGPSQDPALRGSPLTCPHCRAATLRPHEWRPLTYYRCSGCGGAYVSESALEKFVAEVGQAEGIKGGEWITGALGAILDIIVSPFK